MPKITKKVIEDPKKKKQKDEVMERYDEKLAVMSRKGLFFVIKPFLRVRLNGLKQTNVDGLPNIYSLSN